MLAQAFHKTHDNNIFKVPAAIGPGITLGTNMFPQAWYPPGAAAAGGVGGGVVNVLSGGETALATFQFDPPVG